MMNTEGNLTLFGAVMRYYQTCVSKLPKEYVESDDRQWMAYLVQNVTSLNEDVCNYHSLSSSRVSVLGFWKLVSSASSFFSFDLLHSFLSICFLLSLTCLLFFADVPMPPSPVHLPTRLPSLPLRMNLVN